MVRQVKYRAWLRKEKKMMNVSLLDLEDKQIIFQVKYGTDDGYDYFTTSEDFKDVELMQFTGLVDVDGVEIYEGDILQDYEFSRLGRVVYVPEHGAFLILTNHDGNMEYDVFEGGNLKLENTKILGNIWENPELLK